MPGLSSTTGGLAGGPEPLCGAPILAGAPSQAEFFDLPVFPLIRRSVGPRACLVLERCQLVVGEKEHPRATLLRARCAQILLEEPKLADKRSPVLQHLIERDVQPRT